MIKLIVPVIIVIVVVLIILLKSKKSPHNKSTKTTIPNTDSTFPKVKLSSSEIIQLDRVKKANLPEMLAEVVRDKYKDLKPLSAGGMGFVAIARDIETSKKVAIKTILPELIGDKRAKKLFFDECNSIKRMNHPNIVRIYDIGETDQLYYYVMEYLKGESLTNLLIQNKHLSIKQTIFIGMNIAKALQHCHDNKIIHRDIKPSNIFITSKNTVKIIDFGLVKILKEDSSATKGTTRIGTPDFASPEQIQGNIISGKSDIFSLGVCMFFMLTGRFPFNSENIASRLFETALEAKSLRDEIPYKLSELISKCLEQDPDKRLTAGKLWSELRVVKLLISNQDKNEW